MRAFEIIPHTITPLMEAEIPPTRYGYWITPEGEAIAVGFEQHDAIASDHGFMSGYDAMGAGWIRVVAQVRIRCLFVNIEAFKPTTRALSTLRRVANPHEFDEFKLDVEGANNSVKTFNRPGPMLNTVQQFIKRMS